MQQHDNFGLLGQSDYDQFICLTKKCRKRKEERRDKRQDRREARRDRREERREISHEHKLERKQIRTDRKRERTVKKQLANDEKSIQNTGMENQVIQQEQDDIMMGQFANQVLAGSPTPPGSFRDAAPQVQQAGFSKGLLLVIPLLLIGGVVFFKKGGSPPPPPLATA